MESISALRTLTNSLSIISLLVLMISGIGGDMILRLIKTKSKGLVYCDGCGKEAKLTCSGCKLYRYCSRQCQTSKWKDHKQNCSIATSYYGKEEMEKIGILIRNERSKYPLYIEDNDKWRAIEVPAKYVVGKLIQRVSVIKGDIAYIPVNGLEMRLLVWKDLLMNEEEELMMYKYCETSAWFSVWKNHLDLYLSFANDLNLTTAELERELTTRTRLVRNSIDDNLFIIITKNPILCNSFNIFEIPDHNLSCSGICKSSVIMSFKNCYALNTNFLEHKSGKIVLDCRSCKYIIKYNFEIGFQGNIQETMKLDISYSMKDSYKIINQFFPDQEMLERIITSYNLDWYCFRHPWKMGSECEACKVHSCNCMGLKVCQSCLCEERKNHKVTSFYSYIGNIHVPVIEGSGYKDLSVLIGDYCWQDFQLTCKFFYLRYQHLRQRSLNYDFTQVCYDENFILEFLDEV